ncbi:MAG: AGE family epimerase/isomerase [Hyphomonadaceae bacterium]|nr:AGE family epimerase/isomerase [Hyphomonadaceae bacterium]
MVYPPFSEVRSWMFDAALPLWASKGVDHDHGGFLEELDFAAAPTDAPLKRTRVTCRQTYVFAHAATLGWTEGANLAARGVDYLLNKAWIGPQEGFAKKLRRDGSVADATPDLYDLAFTLFAFSWAHRALGCADSLRGMRLTMDFLSGHMRHPEGGFAHELPMRGWRLQNPHMHLFEASLVAFEATQDEVYLDLAHEMFALFSAKFFDGRTLAEYFTVDWRRAPGDEGRIAEPGHQLEWAWILAQYGKVSGVDVVTPATQLVRFAERHGVDPATGATCMAVRDDGVVIDGSSRTWPNTERIKGWLGLFDLTGEDPRAPVARSTRLLLNRYLATETPGLWIDHFDAAGEPIAQTAPASTLYHVFLAFAELLRLEPRLAALDQA